VSVAENGRATLAALEKESFDVILMDIQMPEMDGFEATAAIRKGEESTGRHIPIIAMTDHALKGDQESCLAAGMDGYVSKPIRTNELFTALETALGKYSEGGVVGLAKHHNEATTPIESMLQPELKTTKSRR
jgi:CheY-like chemotaxis protein